MTQPFFSSRKWIKVWITEWRDGTLRWQATDFQRAFWIDLLTLAGRSRYPGIVCAGKDGDKVIGYPAGFLAQNSQITPQNIEETLDLFKLREMITYGKSKSVNGDTLYAITISNWKKYQSDYDANKNYQKKYRERKKASSSSVDRLTSQLDKRKTLDLEVEVDRDKELEVKPSPTKTVGGELGSPEFLSFWKSYPNKVARMEALSVWIKGFFDGISGEILAGLEQWKQSAQWQDPDKIPYPGTFLSGRRWKEAPAKGFSKSEQKARNTNAAIERVKQRLNSGVD